MKFTPQLTQTQTTRLAFTKQGAAPALGTSLRIIETRIANWRTACSQSRQEGSDHGRHDERIRCIIATCWQEIALTPAA